MPSLKETLFLQRLQKIDWTSGVTKHRQTSTAFLSAARLNLESARACELVVAHLRQTGAVIIERDIVRQQKRAYQYIKGLPNGAGLPTKFIRSLDGRFQIRGGLPNFSHGKLKNRTSSIEFAVDPPWLRRRSTAWPSTWWEYLAAIYRPDEKVLVFTDFRSRGGSLRWPDGRGGDAPTGEKGVWYLCNPVDGNWHQVERCRSEFNPEGRTCRSEEAITNFRYFVLESDHKDSDFPGVAQDWLRFLVLLPLRIVAIYTSAGKSFHALVRIDAASKADWDRQVGEMKPFLVEHGADHGALHAVQLTRLPYAYRNGRRQELLYCNPDADGTPIIELPIVTEGGDIV